MKLLIFFTSFWLIISGYFSFLPLFPGFLSILFCVWLINKLRKNSSYHINFSISFVQFIKYFIYLIKEIFISNITVMRSILTNNKYPEVISLPNDFKTHSGTTIFANSVTLTPGTITMDITDNKITVHTLNEETKKGLTNHKMYNKVLKIEK